MLTIYKTDGGKIYTHQTISPGVWINLVNPTNDELLRVSGELDIDPDLLHAALDEEERARIEFLDETPSLIIVDIPYCMTDGKDGYETIPLGIVLGKEAIVTVCLMENIVLNSFISNVVKTFSTNKRGRFVLQILYKISSLFLVYLKQIDRRQKAIEHELYVNMNNDDLISLLGISKSLVYFNTSLTSNELVMEKLFRHSFMRKHAEDNELLEDAITENKQAIETARTYADILNQTMNAFSSVISNSLNITMKRLTSITVVMAVPTIIGGLWGMNVPVPWESHPFGFVMTMGVTTLLTGIVVIWLSKKRML